MMNIQTPDVFESDHSDMIDNEEESSQIEK